MGSALNGTQANCEGEKPFGTVMKGPYQGCTASVENYAEKYPHPWGLCNMHGNVWQWCQNKCYNDSQGGYVVRGGSWLNQAWRCRAAYSLRFAPGLLGSFVGCRVCFRLD